MLIPLVLMIIGAGTASLILGENIFAVYGSLRMFASRILIVFGALGVMGAYVEIKYGRTYFSHLESANGWDFSKHHILKVGIISICVMVCFGAFWIMLWGVEEILGWSFLLMIVGTGMLVSLSVTLLGTIFTYK